MDNQPQYIWPSKLQSSNPDDQNVLHLAQTLYSEFAGEAKKNPDGMANYMRTAASAAQNLYGKKEYAGQDYDTYLYNRFMAIKSPNANTPDAMNGNFDTPDKQYAWKKAMQIAYGVTNGLIKADKAQFYFTKKEIEQMKQNQSFDFNQVDEVGTVGKYKTFAYKQSDAEKLQSKLSELGFYKGAIDGSIGPMTKSALKAYQAANDLEADGIAGPKTKAMLFAKK